jgi:hypothetical protein
MATERTDQPSKRGGVSRRTVLKGVGVGAATAWVAPAVLSQPASAAPAGSPACSLKATLIGANEVPPTASTASGIVTISVDPVSNTVTYDLIYSGLTAPATAAHIHQNPAGMNGAVKVPLTVTAATSGHTTGTGVPIAGFNVADICANPAGFYVNVHTLTFPGGEIRGQLS